MSRKKQFPRKLWAYLSPTGELMPSTIREKQGDSQSALKKCDMKYRDRLESCQPVRVSVHRIPVQEDD